MSIRRAVKENGRSASASPAGSAVRPAPASTEGLPPVVTDGQVGARCHRKTRQRAGPVGGTPRLGEHGHVGPQPFEYPEEIDLAPGDGHATVEVAGTDDQGHDPDRSRRVERRSPPGVRPVPTVNSLGVRVDE
jgi:hypothetical protein